MLPVQEVVAVLAAQKQLPGRSGSGGGGASSVVTIAGG